MHTGKGQLVCCNKPMELLAENTVDAAKEKHVPVVEKSGKKITVRVGSVPHPMEEKHYIEWVELIADGRVYRRFLKPGEQPEAEFIAGRKKWRPGNIATSTGSGKPKGGSGFLNPGALHKISYGLYIVTSQKGGRFNGQVANAVFQISNAPPTVAVSINKQNLTHTRK